MSGADLIGKDVVLKTKPGPEHARGRVIGYTDVPTVLIETESGERISWRADLTEVAAPPVELPTEPTLGFAYWAHRPCVAVWQLRGTRLYAVDSAGDDCGDSETVEAFTPATAVPTEALTNLRDDLDGVSAEYLTAAIRQFLAAVNSANEAVA